MRSRRPSPLKFIFRISLCLLGLGFFALSRANPELHSEILFKGTEVVAMMMGTETEEENTTMAQRFQDRVKVNRFGNSSGGTAFKSGHSTTNAKAQADQLGQTMSAMKVGG